MLFDASEGNVVSGSHKLEPGLLPEILLSTVLKSGDLTSTRADMLNPRSWGVKPDAAIFGVTA